METMLLVLEIGMLCIVCFFIGAKVGQKVSKGEDIKIPNPVEIIDNVKERKEYREEQIENQKEFNTNLDNINNYDGTELGQRDFD